MRLLWTGLAGVVLLALLIAAGSALTSADETGTSAQFLQPGPHRVGKQDFRLVDGHRRTAANGNHSELSERVLETSLWYPAQDRPIEWLRPGPKPLVRQACPAPLVIYSHGFMSFSGNGAYLAKYLASHGYIVAAPDFPLTRFGAAGGPQFIDVLNQPGDVSFIIDSVLAWSESAENRFAGCIDPERIAAVGLSLGGMTTTLLAFHPEYRDARIQAAVSIAGPFGVFGREFFRPAMPPFMMIAGDIDAMVDYQRNADALKAWRPGATLVTIQGGSHTGFAGVSARLFRWFDNPDSVGCWALRGKLDSRPEVPDDFLSKLRGQHSAPATPAEPLPCRNPELPTALRPQHQQALTRAVVFLFLQSRLHQESEIRDEYRQILEQSLPLHDPLIEVSSGNR